MGKPQVPSAVHLSLWHLRFGPYYFLLTFFLNLYTIFSELQILLEQRYGRAVDWWAFGVLTYEMLLGQSPFRGDDEDEIFDAILEDEPLYPITMPRDAVSILQKVPSTCFFISIKLIVISSLHETLPDALALGRRTPRSSNDSRSSKM